MRQTNRCAQQLAQHFIHSQLDRVGLPHATFTEEAINLIARSATP